MDIVVTISVGTKGATNEQTEQLENIMHLSTMLGDKGRIIMKVIHGARFYTGQMS